MNSAITGASTRKTNRYRSHLRRGTDLNAASGLFRVGSLDGPDQEMGRERRGGAPRRSRDGRSASVAALGQDLVGLGGPRVEEGLDLVGLAGKVGEVGVGIDEVCGKFRLELVELGKGWRHGDGHGRGLL